MEALSQWRSVVEESVDALTPLALDPVRCPVDASFLTFPFSFGIIVVPFTVRIQISSIGFHTVNCTYAPFPCRVRTQPRTPTTVLCIAAHRNANAPCR